MNVKQATVKFFQQHNHSPSILRRVCHKRQVPVLVTEFVQIGDLIPKRWTNWFYGKLSETSRVTWGDANRTMIPASYLADIVDEIDFETTEGAKREWIKKVRNLGKMYVDLEN